MAIQRLKQVERRLASKSEHHAEYVKFMQEYESLGHMKAIDTSKVIEIPGQTNYLPHHFVLKADSTTTKFRVVFDASAKTTRGISLNNALCVGPTTQNDLFAILLRFRLHPVVIKTDIAKMFRQFHVDTKHCDLQRIVWRESADQQIRDFQLLTVTYGTSSAPFLSTRCLKQLAIENDVKYPAASKVLKRDTYVDDIITGAQSGDECKQLVSDLIAMAESAQLQLRKWCSNDKTVIADIPAEHCEENISFDFDKGNSIKALGVKWNTNSDSFSFSVSIEPTPLITKRVMLSELAKVYDPLGLITPITIGAKMLFQELWLVKEASWDVKAPTQIAGKWMEYRNQLINVTDIVIPRCVLQFQGNKIQLHGFSDASEKAYGAVIYMRSQQASGSFQSSMLTSKARVAPLKRLSIERLELCGAALLAELMDVTRKVLQIDCEIFAWTDSTIVLRYIAAHPSRWKTFVAHKVAKIQARIPTEHWRHVKGQDNPADLISRGVTAEKLNSLSLWWKGPSWIVSEHLPLCSNLPFQPSPSSLEERKKAVLVSHVTSETEFLQKYSTLSKLLRVTCYVMRFINLYFKKPCEKGVLSVKELNIALLSWVKIAQRTKYAREYENLKRGKQINSSSTLRQLNPFLDVDGVLRVGGRLHNSRLNDGQKHQLIIPHDSHLCKLLIRFTHKTHLHSGTQLTLTHIQQRYWITRAKSTIRGEIRKCTVCRRHRAETMQQLMGSLPRARVQPSPPFQNTGVDYAGPFSLRVMKGRSNKTFKAYFAIFICFSTKAVHLEAVSDMTTDSFLATLKRFIARRGLCVNIFSDNGSNFVGADNELKRLMQSSSHKDQVTNAMSSQGIKFTYSSPSSPHQGGYWEIGVKSVKFHLRRVVGNTTLTFEEFQTVLCQVEACLNSRPLCGLSSDPNDLTALTPGHFLIGRPLTALPDPDVTDIKINRLSRWQLCQQMMQHFWKRWSMEYLSSLQQRFKWTKKCNNLRVDDLVLINDDVQPPTRWKLGRVCELIPGKDDCVRVVNVKTMTGILKRSYTKLTPLLLVDEQD